MSETISATYQYLLSKYGPLLTLKHVAEVMHTTPNGVRMAITRQRQPFAAGLADAQRRVGRRVYFEARRVAAVIDHGASSPPPGECSSAGGPVTETGVSDQRDSRAPICGRGPTVALKWGA